MITSKRVGKRGTSLFFQLSDQERPAITGVYRQRVYPYLERQLSRLVFQEAIRVLFDS